MCDSMYDVMHISSKILELSGRCVVHNYVYNYFCSDSSCPSVWPVYGTGCDVLLHSSHFGDAVVSVPVAEVPFTCRIPLLHHLFEKEECYRR